MEREKQEAWELAKQLVQIDSSDPGAYEEEIGYGGLQTGSRNRSQTLASWQTRSMRSCLWEAAVCYNVRAKIPGKTEGPGLIYICHMDTVRCWGMAGYEDISPLGAMIRDGKMYGRGACDMKSGLACFNCL